MGSSHDSDRTLTTGSDRRRGDTYLLTPEEIASFRRDGYVHLRGVMSEDEMTDIEAVYERFLRGADCGYGQGLQRHDHR